MFNAYNISFYLEETIQHQRALDLARKEDANHPTQASNALLALSYYIMGEQCVAEAIATELIIGKSIEAEILLMLAEIYKASGKSEKALALKPELLGALYELMPVLESRLRSQ